MLTTYGLFSHGAGEMVQTGGVVGRTEASELEGSFSELALALFSSDSVAGTLQSIVDRASATIDGCDAAGVLVVEDGIVAPSAISSQLVVEVDAAQIESGEGPCLDASSTGKSFYAEDLLDDDRWPAFAPRAVALGIRSVLAYPLLDGQASALNLYGRLPSAFGATGRAQGLLFATLARLALNSAEDRESEEKRSGHLTEALRTRELIGQAQGILIERERITADQAFDVLRRASQHLNIKLREVAERLVETGETPGRPPPPEPAP